MTIKISTVNNRMSDLAMKAERLGGYDELNPMEKQDLRHCLKLHAQFMYELESLKQLSVIAYENKDYDWHHEICSKLDDKATELLS